MTARMSPDARRSQLVEITLGLLDDRAAVDLTVRDVAVAAGVSRGLVYRYFPDMDELLVATYQRFFVRLQTDVEAILHTARDVRTGLRQVVHVHLSFAQANATTYRHLVDGGLVLRADVRRIRARRFHRLARFWGDGTDAVVTATALVGLLESATLAWLEHGDGDIEHAVSLVWRLIWGVARGVESEAEVRGDAPFGSDPETRRTRSRRGQLDVDFATLVRAVQQPGSVIDLDQARHDRRRATSTESK